MSASNKKNPDKLTERQQYEQDEAKKLKIYTSVFVAGLALIIVLAVLAGVVNSINKNGIHEKNTIAAQIGSHKISDAEMSYYFMDYANNFNSTYGSYAWLYGIDTSTPIDQQVYDTETGETWADIFMESAMSNARTVYALCDAAAAEGYTLPADEQSAVDSYSSTIDTYASLYGYASGDALLKAQYGNGATKESYIAYYTRNQLATSYQTHCQERIEDGITAEEIAEKEAAAPEQYSSYSYNQYYLSVSKFLTGGTTAEDGTVTYSAEEQSAAAASAKEAADSLAACTTVAELDAAIAALPVNADTTAASTAYNGQGYSSVSTYFRDWVIDSARTTGDATVVPVSTTSASEDGAQTEDVSAYYVVLFNGVNTNETELVNVRHILVSFSGETDDDGNYTEEAKAANKTEAERILASWDGTEEGFASLANENSSDTGSNTNGGLYENVYPGQMVTAFNDWCFGDRTVGDTGVVETEYGYHIMYFCGTTGETYRNYQVKTALVNDKVDAWYNDLVSGTELISGDTSYVNTSVMIGSN